MLTTPLAGFQPPFAVVDAFSTVLDTFDNLAPNLPDQEDFRPKVDKKMSQDRQTRLQGDDHVESC